MLEHQADRHSDRGFPAAFLRSLNRWAPIAPGHRVAYAGLARSEHSAPPEDGPGFESPVQPARDTDIGLAPGRKAGLSLPARAWIIVGAAAALWAVAALGVALLF